MTSSIDQDQGLDASLFPKAREALAAVCAYPGYPERALHHLHRKFFYRHSLIETHAPGRIRCTAKGTKAVQP